MNLSKTSFTARLYKYFYAVDNWDLPNSLCPYFWKVLIAYALVIPLWLLGLPYLLLAKIAVDMGAYKNNNSFLRAIGGIGLLVISTVTLGILYILGSAIFEWGKWLFNAYSYDWELATSGGAIVSSVGFSLIILLVNRYFQYRNQPTLVEGYVSAKYNKLCPKIEWK